MRQSLRGIGRQLHRISVIIGSCFVLVKLFCMPAQCEASAATELAAKAVLTEHWLTADRRSPRKLYR